VRYGGEEFAILLPHTGVEDAKMIGEKLRQIMHETEWPNRPCTASIGICSLTPDMKDPAVLIERADTALYYAKEKGRDRVVHVNEMSTPSKKAA
jgi:diguanylate cyclase (GGDEF)-like protein